MSLKHMKSLIVLVVGLLAVGCATVKDICVHLGASKPITPEQKQKVLRDSVVEEYEWKAPTPNSRSKKHTATSKEPKNISKKSSAVAIVPTPNNQVKQQTELSQASFSKKEKTRKLRELDDQYLSGEITPREYYRRRELIRGLPQGK